MNLFLPNSAVVHPTADKHGFSRGTEDTPKRAMMMRADGRLFAEPVAQAASGSASLESVARSPEINIAKQVSPWILGQPWVLVITVPGKPASVARMKMLRSAFERSELVFEEVHAPNMRNYCPEDMFNNSQSKAAGRRLLEAEWHSQIRNISNSDLSPFQAACLIGHARAWSRVVEADAPAVILEDDANVTSAEMLLGALAEMRVQAANVFMLDPRHCPESTSNESRRISPDNSWDHNAFGTTAYAVDTKAARAFLNFSVDVPVDLDINRAMSGGLRAYCPATNQFEILEFDHVARKDSSGSEHCDGGQRG